MNPSLATNFVNIPVNDSRPNPIAPNGLSGPIENADIKLVRISRSALLKPFCPASLSASAFFFFAISKACSSVTATLSAKVPTISNACPYPLPLAIIASKPSFIPADFASRSFLTLTIKVLYSAALIF